jgi:MoaA/NifB/PqqE/SkfB family radical SAM enzyme
MSPVLFEQILNHLSKLDILDKSYNTVISLFNWGEPFLNPEINDILRILKDKKLYASISSNFIVRPDVDKECLPVISALTFSMSGFRQDSYGRIHAASLDKVLENFNDFYVKMRKHSPKTKINIAWHRYTFNENEFWAAYKYFNRLGGIRFAPAIAYMNDGLEMMDFLENGLSEDRKKLVEKDLFVNHIRKRVAYHKEKSKGYRCPAWNFLVIDETGQLLLCCGVTGYDSDHVLGNILEMSKEKIWKSKLSDPLCNKCLSSGLARWAYSQDVGGFHDKPWPSGGGLYRLKLWFQWFSLNVISLSKSNLGKILRKLPNGEKIIYMIKKWSLHK